MFKSIHSWLVRADPILKTDLIFVLAGLQARKAYGLELFRMEMAPRILLSTGRFEIRRFVTLDLPQKIDLLNIVNEVPPPQRHFFVSFIAQKIQIRRMSIGTLGTLREIVALKQWLSENPEITSILIISSETHLRRLRICCRALLPQGVKTHFAAVQEENSSPVGGNWWRKKELRNSVLLELVKILCYCMLLPIFKLKARRLSLHPPVNYGTNP